MKTAHDLVAAMARIQEVSLDHPEQAIAKPALPSID